MFQSALISTCTLSDSLINTNLSNRDFMFIKWLNDLINIQDACIIKANNLEFIKIVRRSHKEIHSVSWTIFFFYIGLELG